MLVQAPGEKLVPGVDGCLLRLVHQDVFFLQAQAAGVVTCLEGGAVGEDPPLDVDVVMEDAFVLKGPDIASQLGMPVQDLVKGVASREASVEQLEELPTNVALDTLTEGWVEPQNVAAASPPPSSWAAGWAVDEVVVVASPLEGVLEGSLGRLEHGLV